MSQTIISTPIARLPTLPPATEQKTNSFFTETVPKPVWKADSSVIDLFSLKERTFVVTGGARGVGITVAKAIAGVSGDVVCLDILPEPASDEWDDAQRMAKKQDAKLTYKQTDVTDADSIRCAFDKIAQDSRYNLRGLVCCAGVQQMVPVLDYPVDVFRRVMDVNVVGTFLAAQGASRIMRRQDVPGSIVIVASMSGSIANKGLTCTAYNTSKSATLQLSRSMAAELSNHPTSSIRVNTLSPGYIRTAMTDLLLAEKPDLESIWLDGSMLGRLAQPEEFKAPVIFLLGDGSSYCTGMDLRVDGGHCAW